MPFKRTWIRRLRVYVPLGLIGLIILASLFGLVFPPQSLASTTFEITDLNALDAIQPGETITQIFVAPDDYTQLGLYYADYYQIVDDGEIVLKIIDSYGNSMEFIRPLRSLLGNAYFYLDYSLVAGEAYSLEVTLRNSSTPITFFTTTSAPDSAILMRDGQHQSVNLILAFASYQKNYFFLWYSAVGITLITCYLSLFSERSFRVRKNH